MWSNQKKKNLLWLKVQHNVEWQVQGFTQKAMCYSRKPQNNLEERLQFNNLNSTSALKEIEGTGGWTGTCGCWALMCFLVKSFGKKYSPRGNGRLARDVSCSPSSGHFQIGESDLSLKCFSSRADHLLYDKGNPACAVRKAVLGEVLHKNTHFSSSRWDAPRGRCMARLLPSQKTPKSPWWTPRAAPIVIGCPSPRALGGGQTAATVPQPLSCLFIYF